MYHAQSRQIQMRVKFFRYAASEERLRYGYRTLSRRPSAGSARRGRRNSNDDNNNSINNDNNNDATRTADSGFGRQQWQTVVRRAPVYRARVTRRLAFTSTPGPAFGPSRESFGFGKRARGRDRRSPCFLRDDDDAAANATSLRRTRERTHCVTRPYTMTCGRYAFIGEWAGRRRAHAHAR